MTAFLWTIVVMNIIGVVSSVYTVNKTTAAISVCVYGSIVIWGALLLGGAIK